MNRERKHNIKKGLMRSVITLYICVCVFFFKYWVLFLQYSKDTITFATKIIIIIIIIRQEWKRNTQDNNSHVTLLKKKCNASKQFPIDVERNFHDETKPKQCIFKYIAARSLYIYILILKIWTIRVHKKTETEKWSNSQCVILEK